METAQELALLPESFVFVDDNPAEREIIKRQFPGVSAPDIEGVERYIQTLDHSGFFEVTHFSKDDLSRNAMYQENAKRHQLELSFENYEDYLKSLEMKGEVRSFVPMYMSRIAQLTNKSNQFNLTTKRYNQAEIEEVASDRITQRHDPSEDWNGHLADNGSGDHETGHFEWVRNRIPPDRYRGGIQQ